MQSFTKNWGNLFSQYGNMEILPLTGNCLFWNSGNIQWGTNLCPISVTFLFYLLQQNVTCKSSSISMALVLWIQCVKKHSDIVVHFYSDFQIKIFLIVKTFISILGISM